MSMIARRLGFAVVVAILSMCAIACDRPDTAPPGNPAPPPNNPPPGSSRLEWDQVAASAAEVGALSFRLYINSFLGALVDVHCSDTPGQTGYVCSGELPRLNPGTNVLQLSSVLNGIESQRSSPLTVNTPVMSETDPEPSGSDAEVPSQLSRTVCDDAEQTCFDVHVLATNLKGVSALTVVPDERVFFVEHGTRVRVIVDGNLVKEPALEIPPDSRAVGMAIDESQFPVAHKFYLAIEQASPSGQATLSVTRFRELADHLGEGATIVTGLAVPAGTTAPLAVDHQGLVYVGVPALPGRVPLIESGVVLRFAGDGHIPEQNPRASPLLTTALPRPTALAIDSAQESLWVAGRDASSGASIATIPLRGSIESWPQGLTLQSQKQGAVRCDPGVLFDKSSPEMSLPIVLIDGSLRFVRVAASNRIVTQGEIKLALNINAPVVSVAGGSHASIYVVAGQNASSILQLVPLRSHRPLGSTH
jgi:hypothetical protein